MNKSFWLAFTLLWMLFAQAAFGQTCPTPPGGTLGIRSNEVISVSAVDGATITLTSSSNFSGTVEWFLNGSSKGSTGTTKSISFIMSISNAGEWKVKIGGNDTGEEIDLAWYPNKEVLVGGADLEALKKIYYSTDGPNWTKPTSWTSNGWNPAVWNDANIPLATRFPDVTFDVCGRATKVNFGNYLRGTLPQGDDFASNGAFSEVVDFTINGSGQLTGSIPSTISRLKKLKRLSLYSCGFTGGLPSSVGDLSELGILDIFANTSIGGNIPSSLNSLKKVKYLRLAYNGFTGQIPDLSGMTELLSADFYLNINLTGFAGQIGTVSKLKTLSLRACRGITSLPAWLSNYQLDWKLDVSEFGGAASGGLTSLPTINTTSLDSLIVTWNRLDFNHILSQPSSLNPYTWFSQYDLDFTSTSGCSLSVAGKGANTYQWYRDNVAISGETSATISLSGKPAGYYRCRLNVAWNTDPNKFLQSRQIWWTGTCPPAARPIDEDQVEAASDAASNAAIVYPNPVAEGQTVTIRLPEGSQGEVSFSVLDAAGQSRRGGRVGSKSDSTADFSLNGLPSGVYTIQYTIGGVPRTVKVVKQ